GDGRPTRAVLNPEAAPLDLVAELVGAPPVVARARLASLLHEPLDLRRGARGLVTALEEPKHAHQVRHLLNTYNDGGACAGVDGRVLGILVQHVAQLE